MESKSLEGFVTKDLPSEIVPSTLQLKQSVGLIKNYVASLVPYGDRKNIEHEFQWRILLEHHSLVKDKKLQSRRKKTFLTRKERVTHNLLKLPKDGWNYKKLQPMRNMWLDYMRQNFNLIDKAPQCSDPDWLSFSTIAAKSELVGAELKVIRSKVPSLVGMSGTVVLETKMSIQIVTDKDQLKTIIKDTSVFQFNVDGIKFIVFGKHIATKPSERSVKKIKGHMIPDL